MAIMQLRQWFEGLLGAVYTFEATRASVTDEDLYTAEHL
jgi:hypothetical protein